MAIKIITSLSEPNEIILPQEDSEDKKYPFFFLLSRSKKEILDNFAILHPIKKTKCHLISHMILVQIMYKRSRANKMAVVHCQNEDQFAEKEGAILPSLHIW